MIVIVVIIALFAGIGIFLLSLAKPVSSSEYLNLYTHSLLSSLLKIDVEQGDLSCKTVSDLVACSFLTPSHVCGKKDCMALANETVNQYISAMSAQREGFRYVLIIEPEGFVALPSGSPYTLQIGDAALLEEKVEKITAHERLQKVVGGTPYLLNVQLVVAKKSLLAA